MLEINIDAETTEGVLSQIQEVIGGTTEDRWGQYKLVVDNKFAQGNIRCIKFDWGVNLLEYDITFFQETVLIMDTSQYNPIHFSYCLKGHCEHRFGFQNERKKLDQFQSVIITCKDGGYNHGFFPKEKKLKINVIQIVRKKYLKKRLNLVETLNQKLYTIFLDKDHDKRFSYYGTYNLEMADEVKQIGETKSKGMIRVLQIEGIIYQILSMHIEQHDREMLHKTLPTTLLKKELKIIKKLAKKIIKDPAKQYSLEVISGESGLSQAKLQEGFKLVYARTVTEYIRHIRLLAARDLMKNSDLNVSEIVYSVGFSSRSYFSKIFKEKFDISPSSYKEKLQNNPKAATEDFSMN